MRAVVVGGPKAEDWREVELDGKLETLQELVGGYIEALPMPANVATILRE